MFYKQQKPWLKYPKFNPAFHQKRVAIIGGGLAGSACAFSLAQRDWQVTLLEQNQELAQQASGQAVNLFFTKLSHGNSTHAHFYQQCYLSAIEQCQQLFTKHPGTLNHSNYGLIQLAFNDRELKRQQKVITQRIWPTSLVRSLNSHDASILSGISIPYPGLLFPNLSFIEPKLLCQLRCQQSNITVRTAAKVIKIIRQKQLWRLVISNQPPLFADIVIFANAWSAKKFPYLQHLPLQQVRGQLTLIPQRKQSPQLKKCISFAGFITPAYSSAKTSIYNNYYCIGATYDRENLTTNIDPKDHSKNLTNLKAHLPDLYKQLTPCFDQLKGTSGIRCQTPDYLPIVGPLPIADSYIQSYQSLSTGAHNKLLPLPKYYPGLFACIGHGSRGLISSGICGEIIASAVENMPLPISPQLTESLHPGRFLISAIKRKQLNHLLCNIN